MLKHLLLCLLFISPVAAQNLLQNGSFTDTPKPQGYPGMEDHAGAYELPIPRGSGDLPGWTITGKIELGLWKRGWRTVQLSDRGGIQQTVVTKPSQQYVIRFNATHDSEGPAKQTMAVKVAGRTFPVDLPAGSASQDMLFVAEGPQTTVEFVGTSQGAGLRIQHLSLTAYDPKTEKARPIFDRLYRGVMRNMVNEPDKITSVLTPDFIYIGKAGETMNAAGFQKLLRKEPRDSSFSALFEDIQVGETQVELVVSQKNRHLVDGKSVTDTCDFKDVWIKSGEEWLWKSRQEL